MGGGNDDASKQAERNERERQAKIAATNGRINAMFGDPSRAAQYDQLASDTTAFLTDDLTRQKRVNDRELKFAMARSGQHGGSVQADTNKDAAEAFFRGTIEAQRRGNAAGADLRLADESGRSNLLAMSAGGLDATTAGSQGVSILRGNLDAARANSTANGLGDMFAQFADTYRSSKEAGAERRGQRDLYNMLYQPGFGYGGKT